MILEMENYVFTSSFETKDDNDNLSIKYSNLYSINGQFTYITFDKHIDLPYVNKWTNTYGWRPNIKIFDNYEDLKLFIDSFTEKEIIETSLLSDNLWYGNVGHALFDGFYPVYLAAVKFGYENVPFVYFADNWTNTKVTANEAIVLFSKNEIKSYTTINKDRLILFKNFISGTGRTGNRVINEEYKLYGEKYNGLEKFKYRMLNSCGAIPDKPIGNQLQIRIINNKRYSDEEKDVLFKVIKYYEHNIDVNIDFLDWADHTSFKKQMLMIQDIDIHITGPGTGMMYMPFLKKGAVNINLGYMEHTQTNTARPNIKIPNCEKIDYIFPGWMEQSICSAASYVNTLYYNRFDNNNIEFYPLVNIIDRAILLIKNKEILENNHNIDAKIFVEYCKRSPNARKLCDYLTNMALFIELFINEHPMAIPKDIVDIELLRKIKDEFYFNRNYEYSQ
jgi:hypothetical protein